MQRGFLVFIAGFAGGIAFRSFFDFGISFAFFFILLGCGSIVFFFRKRTTPFLFAGLFLVAVGIGVLRFDFSENSARVRALDAHLGETIILEGAVVDEPDARASHTKLTIEIEQIIFGNTATPIATKVLIIAERYPEFAYGDTVRVRGVLQKPPHAIEDDQSGGRPFNYEAYLAKDGIYYEMFYPHLERVSSGNGNPVQRALFSLKRAYLKNLGKALPEPHAALAGGITVGAKEALGGELLQMFRTAGIIHIVVLSGYNITIIARTLERALLFLPFAARLGLSSASIVLFALMTGAGATVVRASLMALIVLLARATGRVGALTVALAVAAFLMLIHNPRILVFDPSFQLSFLATVGLLFLAPRAEKLFLWLPARFGIREAASSTLATQVFVLPALIYMTGKFSIVSFVVNILVLPLIPASMLFSFLAGAIAFLTPFASIPFSYVAWTLLEYQLTIAGFFASLPFASVAIPSSFLSVILAFFIGAVFFFLPRSAQGKGS